MAPIPFAAAQDYKQWQTATGVTVGIAGFGVPLGGVAEKEGGAEALGDAVDAGDTVCVLEAMKMENNVAADRAGTVSEVLVEPGDSVGAGDMVVMVE